MVGDDAHGGSGSSIQSASKTAATAIENPANDNCSATPSQIGRAETCAARRFGAVMR